MFYIFQGKRRGVNVLGYSSRRCNHNIRQIGKQGSLNSLWRLEREVDDGDCLRTKCTEGFDDFGDLLSKFSSGDKDESSSLFAGAVFLALSQLRCSIGRSNPTALRRRTASRIGRRYAAVLPEPVFARAKAVSSLVGDSNH